MPISQMILPEFEHEMASTRKTLERVPDGKFSWKPHEKSMTLGGLATHLSNIPSWTKNTFEANELDLAPEGQEAPRLVEAKSTAEVLAAFDQNVVRPAQLWRARPMTNGWESGPCFTAARRSSPCRARR